MVFYRAVLLLMLIGAPCTEALAQGGDARPASDPQTPLTDLDLENLLTIKVDTVFAASKFLQEIIQAPASVSIVTAAEIHNHGYRTLADVLRSVRGFYVSNDRDYSYVGLRGFSRPGDYNTRVLVLINGHRLNDTIFEQALIGAESPLDISLVDRVEVIRGPSSSLYGTSAFFAVVNIITRTGRSFNGVEVEGAGGTQALRDGRVTLGGRTSSGMEGMVSVSAFATDGNTRLYFPEFDVPGQGDGIARRVDADHAARVFATGSARGVQLQGGYGSRRKHIPTGSFGTVFNDSRAATLDQRGFLDALITRQLPARTVLQARAAYDHYVYTGDYPYETGLFQDGANGAWFSTEATATRRFDRHALTAGFEYRDNVRQNQSAGDETGVILDDRRHSKTAALYVEDEFRFTRRLIVNGGFDGIGTSTRSAPRSIRAWGSSSRLPRGQR